MVLGFNTKNFFFSSRRRRTRCSRDWSSDVCSSDLGLDLGQIEDVNEKQAEYLGDILESGRHLLSLINDILDLSKIEAGRMELEPTEFELPSAIENALTLVKERAHRRGIALVRTVDERLGTIRADERKVKQVLLNLLSNA